MSPASSSAQAAPTASSSSALERPAEKAGRGAVFIGGNARYMCNFRGALMGELAARGYRVYGCCPDFDAESSARLRELGATPVPITLSPVATNPLSDLWDAFKLARVLRRLRPEIVYSYGAKPVIYGTIGAALAGVPRRCCLIAGLGYAFGEGGSLPRRMLRGVVSGLYRLALGHAHVVFFQNPDDLEQIVGAGIARRERCLRVFGSGVDLAEYEFSEPSTGPVSFVLVARLLAEKGVREYLEAARRLRAAGAHARFLLVGGLDPNPNGLGRDEVERSCREAGVEWTGQVPDVRPALRRSSVFVLPSYYREGTPRSALEAMATGRAIITTDWPGCRETVFGGRNGILIPVRSADALASAMQRFIDDPGLAVRMGAASRELCAQYYDVHRVNDHILRAILPPAATPAPTPLTE